jgi:hypothetical protein
MVLKSKPTHGGRGRLRGRAGLGPASNAPTLTVPLTTFDSAKGVVETNVPVPRSNGGVAKSSHSFDLKYASCNRTPRPM